MINNFTIIIYFLLFYNIACGGNNIPFDRILTENELLNCLDTDNPDLAEIRTSVELGQESEAIIKLSNHLKEKISDRYYFNWINFNQRFKYYQKTFPEAMKKHQSRSEYQKSTYPPETSWELPFKNLKDQYVTAYELRHLARQQKSRDMTLMYFSGDEPENMNYFVRQAADLNRAFADGSYDDAGNGVYEVYRAGRRIHNWLFNHNAYLSDPAYNDEKQILLIRTFLHHGAQLFERTKKNRYGNHHTKGLVALFEIAALFPEFEDSKDWQDQAIRGLTWHIENEINKDGFQFERSVHYHKGDIENYFRVYQLAKINNIDLPESFVRQFKMMFGSLVKLAQPNKKLPVLQDDTDKPFAENNQMDDALTIGAIVFEDSIFRYFSTNKVPGSVYWFLRDSQLSKLDDIAGKSPQIGSTELAQTGYYIMRDGWAKKSMYMTITAGLSDRKPDHQHGDMLGVVAYANNHEILPNYQVKYKDSDYHFWKNSWAKNVALVDNIPLGRGWTANSGKSGFGKWKYLPEPTVISWIKENNFDYFMGTHNGFDSINVSYFREVIFLHEAFWLVNDYFEAEGEHTYQQVWQGDYNISSDSLLEKKYGKDAALRIKQFVETDYKIESSVMRDKHYSVSSVEKNGDFNFITMVKPISVEQKNAKNTFIGCLDLSKWQIQKEIPNLKTDATVIMTNFNRNILVNCSYFSQHGISFKMEAPATFILDLDNELAEVTFLGRRKTKILEYSKHKLVGEKQLNILSPGTKITMRL